MITDADIAKLQQVFATKDDLKSFATKDDLKSFATKKDLQKFATKDDLVLMENGIRRDMATKDDIRSLRADMSDFKEEIIGCITEEILNLHEVFGRHDERIQSLEVQHAT